MRVIVAVLVSGVLAGAGALPAKSAATPLESNQADELLAGRKLIENGHPQQAIEKYFDPVIAQYEKSRKKDTRYFSANSQGQAFIYSALPAAAGDPGNVIVTDANWADAYLMKGYALMEMNRIADAQSVIEKAIALSPLNSQYKAELAYTYQQQKDCARSIELYAEAESNAQNSDDSIKTQDLTRAWRGQGYCLVEQGKWDEAAAIYRKCLALDPKDNRARGELRYVEEHTPPGDPHATP